MLWNFCRCRFRACEKPREDSSNRRCPRASASCESEALGAADGGSLLGQHEARGPPATLMSSLQRSSALVRAGQAAAQRGAPARLRVRSPTSQHRLVPLPPTHLRSFRYNLRSRSSRVCRGAFVARTPGPYSLLAFVGPPVTGTGPPTAGPGSRSE